MAHVDQQQPWTLSFRAKAKSLDFKFKSSRLLPVRKLFRFSIQLKLHPYMFEIKSKPRSSFFSKTKSLNLKLLRMLKNFDCKRSKNRGIVGSWFAHKNIFYGRRRIKIWLGFLLCAMVGFFVIMQLLRYYFVWKYLWTAWNYAAPSALFYHFTKVIFDGIWRSMGLQSNME